MSEQKYEETPLYRIRHSAAHVMAQAVLEFYPEAKYTIGPPVENGFYYDFEFSQPITAEDLEKIEKRMRQIVAGSHKFEKKVVSADEARQVFASQPYKLELIEGLEKGGLDEYGNPLNEKPEISLYQHDKFVDLCRGPHVPSTGKLGAFKLMKVAGAYWRGDSHNPMLTRIYGTAWANDKDLQAYLTALEEAEKLRRDGIQLTTFMIATDEALVDFVDTMTKIARGRAYYASPTDLATFVFRDYIRNRNI